MSTLIAGRYARALMNLAAAADQVDQVAAGLDDLADTLLDVPQLGAFLADARVPQAAKQETVAAIVEKSEVPELVGRFVRYVTQKRRIALLDEMRAVFHRLADERQGRAQAEAIVAAELSPEQEQAIRAKLEALSGKQITLAVKVDPEIIGGAITRIGSTVRDGSLRFALNQILQTITDG